MSPHSLVASATRDQAETSERRFLRRSCSVRDYSLMKASQSQENRMLGCIETYGQLKNFCRDKIELYQRFLDKFNEEQRKDEPHSVYHAQVYWLGFNLVELGGRAAHANIAQTLLARIEKMDDAHALTEQHKQYFLNTLLKLPSRVESRSTSASANIMEDYTRVFWQELVALIHEV